LKTEIQADRLERARILVSALEKGSAADIAKVTDCGLVRGVLRGTYPLEGVQYLAQNHFHLINNDIKNLAAYVVKARDEEEVNFFLMMTVAETQMLDSLYILWRALGQRKGNLLHSEPQAATLARTDYFSVLAMYGTPGEIALAILLNFPLWASGAKLLSKGLKKNYGFGKEVPGTGKLDTDLLDRFSRAAPGFRDKAIRIVARDLDDQTEARMRQVGRIAVEMEGLVWKEYSDYAVRKGLVIDSEDDGR
jgi:thiaminase